MSFRTEQSEVRNLELSYSLLLIKIFLVFFQKTTRNNPSFEFHLVLKNFQKKFGRLIFCSTFVEINL